jgi:sulfur-oxidizing protein SoxZ
MSTLKIRTKRQGELTLIRILIDHPMETGRRKEETTGKIAPAHFITDVKIEHNGRLIVRGELSTAVSRNPYLSVRLRGGKIGDVIRASWRDNLGGNDSAEAAIA